MVGFFPHVGTRGGFDDSLAGTSLRFSTGVEGCRVGKKRCMTESVVPQNGVVGQEPVASPTVKRSRRSPLVKGLLWVGLAVAAYKFIPIYYYYLELRMTCSRVLRDAEIESDEEIRLRMVDAMERHGFSVSARDIQVDRGGGKISIVAPYREDMIVNLLGRPVRIFSFSFSPSAERVYK